VAKKIAQQMPAEEKPITKGKRLKFTTWNSENNLPVEYFPKRKRR